MIELKYVVLRKPIVTRSSKELGYPPKSSQAESSARTHLMDVEELSLNETDRADLARDPRTAVVAAAMPMALIEPTAIGEPANVGDITWGLKAVNLPSTNLDGSGCTIAVLDTGIDPNHPAFEGLDIVQKNFTTEGPNDEHGHGTHCAGTIFGKDVEGVRIGIARGIKRALIGKILGDGGGSSGVVVKAINWSLANDAHVISMSLGIDFPGYVDKLIEMGLDPKPATSLALEQYRANINLFNSVAEHTSALSEFGQGCVIIAAAGNESNRPDYEIAASPPAAGRGIISVGALGQTPNGLAVAKFSNTAVDVAAPGVDIVSAKLGGGLVSMNGTSMAAPHAAGVAALWAQKHLQIHGNVVGRSLAAHLIARASTETLAPGYSRAQVGDGLVHISSKSSIH